MLVIFVSLLVFSPDCFAVMKSCRITLIEPYYGGSHRVWADGLAAASQHEIRLLTMPAQFWKWRMQGGAVTIARLFREQAHQPDLILASDMLDLSLFRVLTRDLTADVPVALYFHENQLSYPQNHRQRHGWQYGFINYASALAADTIWFNSQYHLDDFLAQVSRMLKHFADYNELDSIDQIRGRASVLPLGLDLKRLDGCRPQSGDRDGTPLILWNHRWEADKNPVEFADAMYELAAAHVPFRLAITGENFRQMPGEFERLRMELGDRIVQYGYLETYTDYARWLWAADFVVSTAHQDFFGIAIAEAMYCGCTPILPRRLNYPHLLPAAYHDKCLYRPGRLASTLRRRLMEHTKMPVDTSGLRAHVAAFDWQTMIRRYDDHLAALCGV